MKTISFISALVPLCSSSLFAATLIGTSFENSATGGQYTDTGDAALDHDLVNNSGEAEVDYVSTSATELGYNASYVNTRNDVGLTDGDFVGTTDFTGDVGAFTDGSQGYQMSDTDGQMILTFDLVDMTGLTGYSVVFDYFINDTGYESTDSLIVDLVTDSTTISILNFSEPELEANGDSWITSVTAIPDAATSAQLVFRLDTNSSAEAVYFDNVLITDTPVPEPSSALLALSAAGLFLVRRR